MLQLIIRRKIGLRSTAKVFSVNNNAIETNDILDIHRYLMKKKKKKKVFALIN